MTRTTGTRSAALMVLRVAFLLTLLVLAAAVVPALVHAQGTDAPMSEAQFIALAGAEAPAPENTPPEPSRPHETAKAEDSAPEESEEPDESDSDDADEPDSTDDETADGAGDEADAAAETPDAEFTTALAAEGTTLSLEDLPAEARPLVAKKLKDMEAGFTRVMQQVRAGERAALSFKAEERFRKEHPADFIVAMLLEQPAVADLVNERIDELTGNKTAAEGHKALVEKARREAMTAEEGEVTKATERQGRVEQIITAGRTAARAAGVPFDMGVEEGIAAHLAIHGEITEQEIRGIANAKAAVYQRTLRQVKREASGKYVADKVQDRRTAGVKVKPGRGSAPAPAARPLPKNDEEFIAEFASRQ